MYITYYFGTRSYHVLYNSGEKSTALMTHKEKPGV